MTTREDRLRERLHRALDDRFGTDREQAYSADEVHEVIDDALSDSPRESGLPKPFRWYDATTSQYVIAAWEYDALARLAARAEAGQEQEP